MHRVEDRKVTHKLQEEANICHVIEQVLVSQLFWSLISQSLGVEACAFAILANKRILYHLAFDTFEVLKLITDGSSIHQVN